jgi:alginate O-acetyltransferase complex protein AlgI
MLFSSVTFLFYFLPTLFLVYFPFRKKINIANFILLAASLLFYAWGEPVFILIMLFSIGMNYVIGLLIDKHKKYFYIFLGIILNLTILIYFKYFSFLLKNIAEIFGFTLSIPEISLPLGISFFTFQAITYLVDLYKKEIPVQRNLLNLALYIALFPQLIAGPIVRYYDIQKQIKKRIIDLEGFTNGVRRFIIGFCKKVLIANTFGQIADEIFALPGDNLTPHLVIFAVLSYTIQIYFDFSAYSDMAIGLGKMFGFKFKENFNYPYISKTIQEFWRRWHISLSSFLKDYLYVPLGGSRSGKFKTYRNLCLVFLLCGLWHGAGWMFVIWGLYFGFFLIVERMFLNKLLKKCPAIFAWFYMIIVVMFGWLLFRAENFAQFIEMLNVLFYGEKTGAYKKYAQDIFVQWSLVIAIIASTPLFRDKILLSSNCYIKIASDIFLVLSFFIATSFLAAGTYNPFIYFRF